MKRISRFSQQINELTGAVTDLGKDAIILRYDKFKKEKKKKNVELILHKGWEIDVRKNQIRVVLKKHKLANGEVRYTKI